MAIEILILAAVVLIALAGGFLWVSRRLEASLAARLDEADHADQAQKAEDEKRIGQQFELLGRRVFEDSSKKLNDQSLQNLQLLLEPFKDRLKEFEKKVDDVYANERSERGTLRGELNKLMDLNQRMSAETQSLTRALKGDVKTQGTWGELLLENILERSGLRKGEEYLVQDTHRDAAGNVVRPDIIVKLPDGKHIIVDSKMSLLSYEEASRAETPETKEKWSRDFVISLKRHVDGLSAKKYHTLESLGSPDFVILFIPLEPAFAMAFQLKPEIFTESWDKNIALVSPTTLLTTLRTVAVLWRQDRQEKNALEIADRGGKLYDKFVAFVKDVEDLGKQIQRTQEAHESLVKKLHEGNGNLISQVEKLRELGAKTEKKLGLQKPPEL
ncbi:MAG: DNA recombination protein RmuC [Bdellovibrionaceae bacterium]|nr:DNA recombination protein RmuC [Pseudobdellovibrionaceae bacterium]